MQDEALEQMTKLANELCDKLEATEAENKSLKESMLLVRVLTRLVVVFSRLCSKVNSKHMPETRRKRIVTISRKIEIVPKRSSSLRTFLCLL